MNEGGRRHPNWMFALSLLSRVRPGAIGFDPDEIDGLGPDSWRPLDSGLTTDAEIAAFLASTFGPLESQLIVAVTFASHLNDVGPFFVDTTSLGALIESHADLFDDPFFSGDATMLDADSGRVWVVHHDGLAADTAWSGNPMNPK